MKPPSKTPRGNGPHDFQDLSDRAYLAVARRRDGTLEERIEAAVRASYFHYQRTGRCLNITREIVESGVSLVELDDLEDLWNEDLLLPSELTLDRLLEERLIRRQAREAQLAGSLSPPLLSRYVQFRALQLPQNSTANNLNSSTYPSGEFDHRANSHGPAQSMEASLKAPSESSNKSDDSYIPRKRRNSSPCKRFIEDRKRSHWSRFQNEKLKEFDVWYKEWTDKLKEEASRNQKIIEEQLEEMQLDDYYWYDDAMDDETDNETDEV